MSSFLLIVIANIIVFLVICFTISVSVYRHSFLLLISCQFRETEYYSKSCARCCFWWVYFFDITSFIVDGILFFRPFPSCFSSRNHYIHLNIVTSFIFNFTRVKCIIILYQHPITNNYLLLPF